MRCTMIPLLLFFPWGVGPARWTVEGAPSPGKLAGAGMILFACSERTDNRRSGQLRLPADKTYDVSRSSQQGHPFGPVGVNLGLAQHILVPNGTSVTCQLPHTGIHTGSRMRAKIRRSHATHHTYTATQPRMVGSYPGRAADATVAACVGGAASGHAIAIRSTLPPSSRTPTLSLETQKKAKRSRPKDTCCTCRGAATRYHC